MARLIEHWRFVVPFSDEYRLRCVAHITILLLVLLSLASLPVYAAAATAFVRANGSCSRFGGNSLYITKTSAKNLSMPIVLAIPDEGAWGSLVNEWFDVGSATCPSTNPCEDVAHGKIYVLRVYRHLSIRRHARVISGLAGNFTVELKDGTKIEGAFSAKVRKPTHKFICQ